MADGEGVGHVILVGCAGHEASSALDSLGQLQRSGDVLQLQPAGDVLLVGQRQGVALKRAAVADPLARLVAGQRQRLQLVDTRAHPGQRHGPAAGDTLDVVRAAGRDCMLGRRGRAAMAVADVQRQRQAHRLVHVMNAAGDIVTALQRELAVGQVHRLAAGVRAAPGAGRVAGQGAGCQRVGAGRYVHLGHGGLAAAAIHEDATIGREREVLGLGGAAQDVGDGVDEREPRRCAVLVDDGADGGLALLQVQAAGHTGLGGPVGDAGGACPVDAALPVTVPVLGQGGGRERPVPGYDIGLGDGAAAAVARDGDRAGGGRLKVAGRQRHTLGRGRATVAVVDHAHQCEARFLGPRQILVGQGAGGFLVVVQR